MNIRVYLDDDDVTERALLTATRINYDTTRRITTASVTLGAQSPHSQGEALWDAATWDVDEWALSIRELQRVTIIDARDSSKMFAGNIFALETKQTDAHDPAVWYVLDLNDDAAWLDRSVAWGGIEIAMPTSDDVLLRTIIGTFCTRVKLGTFAKLVPVINQYEWQGKTCRQILDEISALSGGEWRVDFDSFLNYGAVANAPPAPYGLSTSPDYVTTFPVRVDSFKSDFTNPINRCFVRGALMADTGVAVYAEYSDPISVAEWGEFSHNIIDDQITDPLDAELRAKTTVQKYSQPLPEGSFTIWQDDLRCGQRVNIREDTLDIAGEYLIRALSLSWKSHELVEYVANFGSSKPDLETYLRLLDQRTRWKSAVPQASVPIKGSITDEDIAPPGLHEQSIAAVGASTITGDIVADQIASVSATTITGTITAQQIASVTAGQITGTINASQIATVNANSIVGLIQAEQIESINAGTIEGVIHADQIGSVHADVIQGVIVSDQLADQIIDDLAKFTTPLRPVPIYDVAPTMPNANLPPGTYFFFTPNGHFYKINAAGTYWDDAGTNPDQLTGALKFYQIGAISATNLIGLILAAQIQSITAGQITGQIQAAQIGSVNASTIVGQITATQIASVNATAIVGQITAGQIQSIDATQITGTIQAGQIGTVSATQITGQIVSTQIGSINAATITIGLIVDGQIGNVSGAKLTVGTVNSDKLNATEIAVGGGGGKPGILAVYDADGVTQNARMGYLQSTGDYGGWFRVFGAGGTMYADAKLYSDKPGNLFIRNANITITSTSGSSLTMGPSTVSGGGDVQARFTSPSGKSTWIDASGIGMSSPSVQGTASLTVDGYGGMLHVSGSTGKFVECYEGRVNASEAISVASAVVINASKQFVGSGGINTAGSIVSRGQLQVWAQAICVMSADGAAYLGYIQADGSIYTTQGVQAALPYTCGGQQGIGNPATTGAVGVDVTTPSGQKTLWFMGGICYAVTG